MSTEPPTTEREFVRIWFPVLQMFLADYTEYKTPGERFRATLTMHKPGAKIFVYPAQDMIRTLRENFHSLELEKATFDEWINQSGDDSEL